VLASLETVVFNLGSRPQRGREPFLQGPQADNSCTQLYCICFIRGLNGGHWVIVDCYNGLRYMKGRKPRP